MSCLVKCIINFIVYMEIYEIVSSLYAVAFVARLLHGCGFCLTVIFRKTKRAMALIFAMQLRVI